MQGVVESKIHEFHSRKIKFSSAHDTLVAIPVHKERRRRKRRAKEKIIKEDGGELWRTARSGGSKKKKKRYTRASETAATAE